MQYIQVNNYEKKPQIQAMICGVPQVNFGATALLTI